jgi:hypothetical protein
MTDTGLILGEPSSYLLFTIFFSLTLSFSLLFPLEDSIKEYYHHTEEETKDYEPCTTVFNPRITKHCDLRGEGVENGVACNLAERILSSVFCLGGELRELVWKFYRRAVCEVVLGCGVAVMEQVTQGNKCDGGGMVLLAVMVVGALQKGCVGWWLEVGHACGGTSEWWGQ